MNELVGGLLLGFVPQGPGTYGSSTSIADIRDDEYFKGDGLLTVVPEPATIATLLGGMLCCLGCSAHAGSIDHPAASAALEVTAPPLARRRPSPRITASAREPAFAGSARSQPRGMFSPRDRRC